VFAGHRPAGGTYKRITARSAWNEIMGMIIISALLSLGFIWAVNAIARSQYWGLAALFAPMNSNAPFGNGHRSDRKMWTEKYEFVVRAYPKTPAERKAVMAN